MPETPSEVANINVSELEALRKDERKKYRCPVCGSVFEREQDRDLCIAQHIMSWLPELEKNKEEVQETLSKPRTKPSALAKFLPKPGDVCIFYVGKNKVRGIVVAEDSNNWYVLNVDNLNREIIDKFRKIRVSVLTRDSAVGILLNAGRPLTAIQAELQKYLTGMQEGESES